MATIKITPDVVTAITGRVREVFEADRHKIVKDLPEVPVGFSDYLYEHLMSLPDQTKFEAGAPKWMALKRIAGCSIRVRLEGLPNWRSCPVVPTTFKNPQLYFGQDVILTELADAAELTWNGVCLCITFKKDLDGVPEKFKAYIKTLAAIPEAHQKISDASRDAAVTMAKYLAQHKTLQSAVKNDPALKHYFDDWINQQWNRKAPPRPKKPKVPVEKEVVDISKLIAKAAVDKLNL